MSDIRKWFMKAHDKGKGNGSVSKPAVATPTDTEKIQENSGRRKTSKYFAADKRRPEDEKVVVETPVKRKILDYKSKSPNVPPSKKTCKVKDDDADDDFAIPNSKRKSDDFTPSKKLKKSAGRGVSRKAGDDESDEDGVKEMESSPKSGGGGNGGRGASGAASRGRGRGAGRGGFMNFAERKDPPHKGEKEVPEGSSDCLGGLTFVISGTLDSMEREEAEDLIKCHGGRVTGSVSKKTNFLLCDEDIGGRKSSKAKELGTAFLSEDGLFDLIRKSNHAKVPLKDELKESAGKAAASLPKKGPQQVKLESNSSVVKASDRSSKSVFVKQEVGPGQYPSLTWTEKYRPKVPNEIIGNQSLINELHRWLGHWNELFSVSGSKGKRKKQSDPDAKKAVLLSGTPGIGKTTAAKLVSQMLGLQMIEVNASDSRGKADSNISKGIRGSNANSIKELVSNKALSISMDRSNRLKTVLIMDEVDGMSAGDRGGVADLIASIKISKIPIICICNDRYSQKLKSLVNYCKVLSFRKPTKQQMAKRLMQVANAEGLQVNEIALEELAERVNGDMRMALNQLQYMSLSMSVIKYDDIRQRLLSSSKDEDISPFTAVDKLLGYNGGKLRMDERIDLSMSDPDLVPLLIQENYINYRPSSVGRDDSGIKRMNLIAQAAESIGDGDIINVQIRRYRQWQLYQTGSLSSCIIPAALLHGQREILEQGEKNFNRFGGWLGKNSTAGKNLRLLEDLHVHFLASRETSSGRETIRLDHLTLLLNRLTHPLRVLPRGEAVEQVLEFMNVYSMSQEDFDTIVELSKFQGQLGNPLEGIAPAVKAALTKAYNERSKVRMVRAADLVSLPGMKKAPKKRIAAILEPSDDGIGEENGEVNMAENEENNSDTEESESLFPEATANGDKLQDELQSLNAKGIEVQVELKVASSLSSRKRVASRGRGGSSSKRRR